MRGPEGVSFRGLETRPGAAMTGTPAAPGEGVPLAGIFPFRRTFPVLLRSYPLQSGNVQDRIRRTA